MRRAITRSVTLFLALSVLTFALADWAPGDFLTALQMRSEVSPETVDAMRRRMTLDRPWHERYGHWLSSAVQGDFGTSLAYGIPVSALLAQRLPNTLVLNLVATLLAWMAALGLGALAAARADGWLDHLIRTTQALLLGVPELLLALFGLWLFGGQAGLPYAVLGLGALPSLLVHTRASIHHALGESAVRAARAHGIRGWRLWGSYVLPLAAPPLISLAGLSFGGLLSASLLVEAALSYPGLGSLLLDAIQVRDTPVVAAVVALAGVLLMAANLAADLARRTLDPRLREVVR